jgi:hypothetical protein
MAYALSPTASDFSERRPTVSRFFKRVVNAIAASRMATAERHLRERHALLGDTVLINGEYRKISFNNADFLPFTD